jgi:tRNA (cmo5U34)-methyltransferase
MCGSGVARLFDAVAGSYDEGRRRLVPCLDDFYGTAVELAVRRLGPRPRILDLGAGTGLLSQLLATARPDAEFVLVDAAPDMLAVATGNLRATLRVQDLRDPLPPGPFDAVVSALAIHHLTDDEKHDLYRRIVDVLVPAGVFVNAEQVAAPTSCTRRPGSNR